MTVTRLSMVTVLLTTYQPFDHAVVPLVTTMYSLAVIVPVCQFAPFASQ